jgi:hypothetical protein
MDWDNLGNVLLKQGLPLLAGAINPAIGVAAKLLVGELGGDANDPDALAKLVGNADTDAINRLKELEARHKHQLEALAIENDTARLRAINKTMQIEARSNDAYVRRWRPTIGYVFGYQMFIAFNAIAYVIVFDPTHAEKVITAFGSLSMIITAEMAVLGISVVQRSNDKKLAAGVPHTGMVKTLIKTFGGAAK